MRKIVIFLRYLFKLIKIDTFSKYPKIILLFPIILKSGIEALI